MVMTTEERQKGINFLTNHISDHLCHLKDNCLADSKAIDSAIKDIIENVSGEIQQGFKRYILNNMVYRKEADIKQLEFALEILLKEDLEEYPLSEAISQLENELD